MDHRRYAEPPNQQDSTLCQILQEAQHRWLRPTEVCEILHNYRKFKLTPDPPQKPQSGSLFLFDRKALRYFRKDGHNWRKKKDGKTIREAHERLKAGSVEVLHCYYAHGEDNENFQRRSYWMLQTNEHIVLVHYREVKEGNRNGMRSPNSYSTDRASSLGNSHMIAASSPQTSPLVSPRACSPNTGTEWNGRTNSYSTDLVSSFGNSHVIAASSPQTSPLVSPRACSPNTSTEWNGHTYSPECDEPESSDDTDQCFLQELEPNISQRFDGMSGIAGANSRNLLHCASFSEHPAVQAEKDPTYLYNVDGASTMHGAVSDLIATRRILPKQLNGTIVPPGGFDLLEWCELLKYGKDCGVPGSYGVSDREIMYSASQTDLLEERKTQQHQNGLSDRQLIYSASQADLLEQRKSQPHQNGGGILSTSSLGASYGHRDSTTVTSEGLGSIKGQIGPLCPVTEACQQTDLQDFTELGSLKVSSEMLSDLTSNLHPVNMENLSTHQMAKHNFNVVRWGAVLEQLDDNVHGQNGIYGGIESAFQSEPPQAQPKSSQTYCEDKQPFHTEHEVVAFDASNNKETSQVQSYSHIFKDFQADTPSQHEERDSFKKLDSFGRWISQEIGGDADNPLLSVSSDSATYWASALDDQSTVDEVSSLAQQMQLDIGLIPLQSPEQCFIITDFSPESAFSTIETKVLVTGTFLDTVKDPSQCKWSVMFGDVEVSAEILQPGVFRCNAPPYAPGRVPLYITQNNRIACSNVKEFEYHTESSVSSHQFSIESLEARRVNKKDMLFQIRLARMLSSGSLGASRSLGNTSDEAKTSKNDLNSLICYEEWEEMEDQLTESGSLSVNFKEKLIQKLLKEKLQIWLSRKALEEGKGASVLDDHGLGVLHMGAALGYTWTIAPILAAGVNINFRDSRGWTALHWAAHFGREAMVVELLAAGAAAGAKTDPTKKCPAGQTPADLASGEQHKGIAGYLAESSLTSHLSSLNLKAGMVGSPTSLTGDIAVETVSERTIVQLGVVGSEDQLSLQDSLAAIRNATQAAARIHSVFRADSFRKKQESVRLQEDEYGISNEQARYIVAAQKTHRSIAGYGDDRDSDSAAISIQRTFRGWKGRRDFLIFRQRIVKIQAHFRGHQVRKKYRNIVWTVGIVEKAILRWRRKGKGLRGFCADGTAQNGTMVEQVTNDGDDDFLKAGRKQTEIGLEKAVARVRSMARSPEARDQYRRLLESYQKTKVQGESHAHEDVSMCITDQ